jgi:hypothetical protein
MTAGGEAVIAVNGDRGSGGVRRYSDTGTSHGGVERPAWPESDSYSGGLLLMMMTSYMMQPLRMSTPIERSLLRPTELWLVRWILALK